jgi:hypothetical protein
MRTVLRSLITLGLTGLALAPTAQADTAVVDLVLARDACGGQTPANTRLDLTTGASTLGCGSMVAITGGATTVYPAAKDALPVVLDDQRDIFVAISTGSFSGGGVGGIGAETIELTLSGKNAATRKTIALGSATRTTAAADMIRNGGYTAEFELDIAGRGGTYSDLTLSLRVGGSQFSGFVDHDGTSFVSLPVTDASVPPETE